MLKSWRLKILDFVAHEYVRELEEKALARQKQIDNEINQRVAKFIAEMDPFEPLMRQFHGVFSQEFQRPEEDLDERGQLGMKMWGWRQKNDPYFKYMTEWIMNTQGNNTVRKAKNDYEWFFGRSAIANILILINEVGRLASLYEEELEKNKTQNFNSEITVE